MEQLKVLAAALALRSFTVEELSALSGVNPKTVHSVVRRNPALIGPADSPSSGPGTTGPRSGPGRPAKRLRVVDYDEARRLVREAEALTDYEPRRARADADELREAAVAVAEDALAKVVSEPDAARQERLIASARSSLYFGNEDGWSEKDAPWWKASESQFAVRARGVSALATLTDLAHADSGTAAESAARTELLRSTAGDIAAAMQAAPPGRAEEIYFAPFAEVLAHSGEFAPLFAVCAPDQEPGFPLAGAWTEAEPADFHFNGGRVVTQPWAKSLVDVSISMPIVVSAETGLVSNELFDTVNSTSRPALVLGPPHGGGLIRETGLIGATFLPVDESSTDRKDAIHAVSKLIDRYSAGR